jgi:hypothetical protein
MKRPEVRTKIRQQLRDFYDVDTIATGGITNSATTLPVSLYSIGDKLTIASELLIVRAVDLTAGTLGVNRGADESVAAAHIAGVAITINPEYSNRDIDLCIDLAVGDTYLGAGGLWIPVVDETLTTTTSREYSVPAGIAYPYRIQIEDGDGVFNEVKKWELIGDKIQFVYDLDPGCTMRILGTSFQELVDDDTSDFDLADEQMQFIIYDAAWHAIQQRFAHRIKATEYSASVNDRAGQPLDMINMVNTLRRTVDLLRQREFKPRPSEWAAPMRR